MKRVEFAAAAVAALASFGLARRGAAAAGRYEVTHTDAEWQALLGPQRYEILRQGGTETAFSSPLIGEKRAGLYRCAGCELALFTSKTKYDSGDGWPSFWGVLPNATRTQADYALIEQRTEVHCRRCGGHLGHIFDDGPPPTHLRYCIDGLALRFVPGRG
ncbi:MAG TPA: peptide-methionine (R)-S-oxide reductase MsrB [Candidatus Cybelea sp.]|jgi:peptide-methionine (R)-S-oxide reductase|nr:peptide-methionine (R)-S-oxide reductase MsrB [Candidatus Cybelea sp.]